MYQTSRWDVCFYLKYFPKRWMCDELVQCDVCVLISWVRFLNDSEERLLLPGQVLDETLFLQKAMLRLVSNIQHNTEIASSCWKCVRARPLHNRMFKGCGNVHDKQVTITWKPSLPRSHVCIAYFHHLPFLFWCNNKTEASVVYFQS